MIKTRTAAQCRSHAQKYFAKLENEKAANLHGGAEELHGAHVVLDGSDGKRRKRGKGDKKKRRKRNSSQSLSSADAFSQQAAREKKNWRKKMKLDHDTTTTTTSVSDCMGGPAAPCVGSVGDTRSMMLMCQQGGLPAKPYYFASVNQSHLMMIRKRGPSPSALHCARGGARSPKTARAQGRASPEDSFLPLGGADGSDSECVSALLRDREALIRPYRTYTKLPSHLNRRVDTAAASRWASFPSSLAHIATVPDETLLKIRDIDRQLLRLYTLLSSQSCCVCRRLCFIVRCREVRDSAGTSGCGSAGCITAQRNMLFLVQSSLVAYPVATVDGSRLLQLWQQAQDSMQKVEMAGDAISIDQTATIYSTMSEKAQTQLHDLDETELTAVQVLVGTRMGLKPRKSPIRLNSSSSRSSGKKSDDDATSVSRTRSPIPREDHVNSVFA